MVLGIALLGLITSAAAINRTAFRLSSSPAALNPVQDTFDTAQYPSETRGGWAVLRVNSAPIKHTYMRFAVPAGTVSRALLRLYVTAPGGTFTVHSVLSDSWNASTLTYRNAPPIGTGTIATGTATTAGWISLDVTTAVSAGGDVNFALTTTGPQTQFSSGTGIDPPELALTLASSPTPTPTPTATPTPTPSTPTLTPTPSTPASTPTPGIVCDGSTDATTAIQGAVNKGGTVTLPAGTCKLSAAIVMRNGNVTLQGTLSSTGQPLTTMVDRVNPQYQGGDIQVKSDHNTVQDLILDQHAYGGALYVQGNYNVVSHDTILGGPSYFAMFAVAQSNGAKAIGNQFLDDTSVALINKNVLGVSTAACDDGFVLANQTGALVQNLDFTGTRLALYQDVSTTVNGYTYHPGPQTCGLDGFYITQPTSGITLENLNMHGSAGIISNGSAVHTPAQNVSISNETVYPPAAGAGFTLHGRATGS